jgi:hypothetical protein
MGKIGRKPFEESSMGVMPIRVIADRMGVSERTVSSDWKSAQKKLQETPGAFSVLLDYIQAVAILETDILQCGSVECDKKFIEKYSEKKEQKARNNDADAGKAIS